jgi:hypothetical protein
LWSIAACWQHKGACFDKGAVHACVNLASEDLGDEATMAAATVIQNLSEHVFNNGAFRSRLGVPLDAILLIILLKPREIPIK